jgi:hypothetical protein
MAQDQQNETLLGIYTSQGQVMLKNRQYQRACNAFSKVCPCVLGLFFPCVLYMYMELLTNLSEGIGDQSGSPCFAV